MEKLIISCSINDPASWEGCWNGSKVLNMPVTTSEIANSVQDVYNAGAAIARVNEPLKKDGKNTLGYNGKAWLEVSQLIRKKTPKIIYEHGTFGRPYFNVAQCTPPITPELQKQKFDLGEEKPDLIDTILAGTDYNFGANYFLLPHRNEIAVWMELCKEKGVKPDFQIWQVGHFYELNALAEQNYIKAPYFVTLFIGSTSGAGSPPSTRELLNRVKNVPEKTVWQLSVMCQPKGSATNEEQLNLLTQAIALGGHVRVGMEDNPFYSHKVPAESNAQLVARIVRIAREFGREVATPAEARKILGLPVKK